MTDEVNITLKFGPEIIRRVKELFGEKDAFAYAILQDDRLADELESQIKDPFSEMELVLAMQELPRALRMLPEQLRTPREQKEFDPEKARTLYEELVRRVNIQLVHQQVVECIERSSTPPRSSDT